MEDEDRASRTAGQRRFDAMIAILDAAEAVFARRGFHETSMEEIAKAAGLPNDPQAMAMMMQQVQAMMSAPSEGPVNWQLAHENARRVARKVMSFDSERQVMHYLREETRKIIPEVF